MPYLFLACVVAAFCSNIQLASRDYQTLLLSSSTLVRSTLVVNSTYTLRYEYPQANDTITFSVTNTTTQAPLSIVTTNTSSPAPTYAISTNITAPSQVGWILTLAAQGNVSRGDKALSMSAVTVGLVPSQAKAGWHVPYVWGATGPQNARTKRD